MSPVVRNVLAVIAGFVVGSSVNMGLIMASGSVIPLPPEIDPTDGESLAKFAHRLEPRHFVFPFLAHALGTLVGALVAAKVAATHQARFAMGIGVFFLLGGIANVFMIPAPVWFIALDLVVAYLPMGWLAGRLAAPKP